MHQTRFKDGSRRVTHVTEVESMEGDVITLQDIFVAKPPDEESAPHGGHRLLLPLASTGLKPHFLDKLAANGVVLQPNFFQASGEELRPSFAGGGYGGGFQ